jgi:hypothetical protein
MKKQIIGKFRALLVFCAFSLCFTNVATMRAAIAGKLQDDRVLVSGNPSLKQSDVDELINFFEWLFEARFNDEQRSEFRTLAIKEWKSGEKAVKGITDIVASHRKFQNLTAAQREQVRQELLPHITASFQTERSDVNVFLSKIYQKADGADSTARNATDSGDNTGGAVTLADLVGTWSSGSVSGERYKNLTSGDLSDASGNMSEYIISANGEIKYTGYLSTTIYACTTKLFFIKTGKISVSGSSVTFDYKTGERDYQNSCNSSLSGVKPISPQKKTVQFTLERDQHGVRFCTVEEGNKTCLSKVG